MPRLPRDVGGESLVRKLSAYGYAVSRQTGSHIRVTRKTDEGQHHVTIPKHPSLRVGTLNNILNDVAQHLGKSKGDLVAELFQ